MNKKTRKRLVILMFLLPSICGFIFFQVFPIVYSFILSLTDWDVLSKADYVGFENYKKIFGSEEFWRVLINTLYYIVLYIPLMIIASLSPFRDRLHYLHYGNIVFHSVKKGPQSPVLRPSRRKQRLREETLFFVSEQKKDLFLVSQSEIKEINVAG